ncbi:hypothetical protein L1885_03445 [Streptomyces fuscigenes]|nr:hypothetical protein [Streptomyces fuscigenes]MCF3960743.1 hypothetical protein [Streptomyces fuscigenes]
MALGAVGESPGGDPEATAAETAELARAAAEYTTFAPGGSSGASSAFPPPPTSGPLPASGSPVQSATSATAGRTGGSVQGGGDGDGNGGSEGAAEKGLPVEDVIVSTRTGYHLLCFVETTFDSSVFLHLWLDRDTGNLALARIRMRQLAERLVLG